MQGKVAEFVSSGSVADKEIVAAKSNSNSPCKTTKDLSKSELHKTQKSGFLACGVQIQKFNENTKLTETRVTPYIYIYICVCVCVCV